MFEIATWKDADRLEGLCTFIAVTRPGYDLEQAVEEHTEVLSRLSIEFIEVPALAISSTDIRRRVAEQRPIRYLVPEAVSAYVAKYSLYAKGY